MRQHLNSEHGIRIDTNLPLLILCRAFGVTIIRNPSPLVNLLSRKIQIWIRKIKSPSILLKTQHAACVTSEINEARKLAKYRILFTKIRAGTD